jgi:predicted Zn-dependent protease
MTYRLLIQPFDAEFDFLEDIGNQSRVVYRPRIDSFEVLPKVNLPEHVLTIKGNYTSESFIKNFIYQLQGNWKFKIEIRNHFEAGEKMVYVEDIFEEVTKHWPYNSGEILLGVTPYFLYGAKDKLNGQALREVNMSVVSNFGFDSLPKAAVGVGLHEIGHNLKLGHCKKTGCLMRYPGDFKDFYEGDYGLCEFHERQISNPDL